MNTSDAKTMIEEAISTVVTGRFFLWSNEKLEALEALAGNSDIAPRIVCETVGVEQGSTWGDVVASLQRGMKT